VDHVVATFAAVAGALTEGTAFTPPDPAQVSADRRQATVTRLAADAAGGDGHLRTDAFTLVWVGEWVVEVARLTADLDGPVRVLTGGPDTPAGRPR
jgi:hypothetical protein